MAKSNYDVYQTVRISVTADDEESASEHVSRMLNDHIEQMAESDAFLDSDVTNRRTRYLGPSLLVNA